MANYSRIAFAQIAANPAYLDDSGNSLLHEPTFPMDEKMGLYTLASIEEVHKLRNKVASAFTTHVSAKVEVTAAFAANQGAGLLVFPEYSIPSPVLSACKSLSDGLNITIVAGSHVATQLSLRDYRDVGLPSGNELVGRAVCPIFIPQQPPRLRQKLNRSKWESSLVPGDPSEPIPVSLWGKQIFLQVSICIDAIAEPAQGKIKSAKLGPTVYVIPALTPSTELFGDRARLLLSAGHVSIFTNGADFGGSRVFARAKRASRWYTEENGTQALPRHSEALVVVEADLSSQYEVRRFTGEHFPVKDVLVFPLLYPDASSESNEYTEIIKQLKEGSPSSIPGIKEKIERFALLDERLFPGLLQEKIKHFFRNVLDLGLAGDSAWVPWLEPLVVKATTSTDRLRWELCGEALELINELLLSGREAAKTDLLTNVYKGLINRRKELGKRVAVSVSSKSTALGSNEAIPIVGALPTPFEPPFYDRQSVLNGVRRFVESTASNCLVLAGMRGIGKTSLAREVFKKVLPPTWRSVWIQLTEGIGYPRLLADLALAHKCGIRPQADSTSQEAAQVAAAQDVLLYLSGTPRVALVLDDVQHALDPSGEFVDESFADLLHNAIRRSAQSRNKIILITTNVPKFPPELRESVEIKYLTGLDREDAENLLSFWYHFEREDLRGQPVDFPDILFRVLAGHPLGLRVAAKMWAETPIEDAELSLFKRLREAVVAYILDRVSLTPREEEFVRFASVFRLPVTRGVF